MATEAAALVFLVLGYLACFFWGMVLIFRVILRLDL